MKILFWAGAYPHRDNNTDGIFIQRHALAVSKFVQIAVIYIDINDKVNKLEYTNDKGILEIITHRKVTRGIIPLNVLLYYLLDCYKAYRFLSKEFGRPDLIHVNDLMSSPSIGFFILYLNKIKRIPYIVTEHSSAYLKESNIFNNRSSIVKKLIRYTLNNSKHIIVVSNKLKSSIIKCGVRNDFSIIYNVVPFCKSKKIDEKRKIKRILHVSLLTPLKNILGIIDAINEIYQKREDFELHIVGDGAQRSQLERIAKDYHLLDTAIFFHGILSSEEVIDIMASSDFHVLNSKYETFSVTTAEALAYGKPVISTRCGGPEEFIDENNGILIDVGDTKALVSAIEYMLDNSDKYDEKIIRKEAKNKFSSEVVGKRIFGIYNEILEKN